MLKLQNERADKMNISFSPNKYGFKAGHEKEDRGSERSGMWQTLGFRDKRVGRNLGWHMAMTDTGRAYSYSLTAIKTHIN